MFANMFVQYRYELGARQAADGRTAGTPGCAGQPSGANRPDSSRCIGYVDVR